MSNCENIEKKQKQIILLEEWSVVAKPDLKTRISPNSNASSICLLGRSPTKPGAPFERALPTSPIESRFKENGQDVFISATGRHYTLGRMNDMQSKVDPNSLERLLVAIPEAKL